MKNIFLIVLIAMLNFITEDAVDIRPRPASPECICDTVKTLSLISDPGFHKLPVYYDTSFTIQQFYLLDSATKSMLWYRDIENPFPSGITGLWNDYYPNNYHASHQDFINRYYGEKNIELAFQFGPNMDLWAYHIFVVRKIDCCFLLTRSYFRHARFTYKAYSILDGSKMDSLYVILQKLPLTALDKTDEFAYEGFFADNRNHKVFRVNFAMQTIKDSSGNSVSRKEISDLYDFIDKKIHWTVTYPNE